MVSILHPHPLNAPIDSDGETGSVGMGAMGPPSQSGNYLTGETESTQLPGETDSPDVRTSMGGSMSNRSSKSGRTSHVTTSGRSSHAPRPIVLRKSVQSSSNFTANGNGNTKEPEAETVHVVNQSQKKWRAFTWLRLAALLWLYALTPVRATFSAEFEWTVILDILCDGIFVFDYLVRCGFLRFKWSPLGTHGEVRGGDKSAKKYLPDCTGEPKQRTQNMCARFLAKLETYCAFELFVSLPIGLVFMIVGDWKVAYVIRLLKISRIRYFASYVDELFRELPEDEPDTKEEGAKGRIIKKANPLIIKLVKLFSAIVLICHVFACAWVAIGDAEVADGTISWYDTTDQALQLSAKPDLDRYLFAVNFAFIVGSRVGYGDSVPFSEIEVALAILLNLVGFLLYGIIIGTLVPIVKEYSSLRDNFERKTEQLKATIRTKRVAVDQTEAMIGYYEYVWDKQMGFDENMILQDDLTLGLRIEVVHHMVGMALLKVPCMQPTHDVELPEGLVRGLLSHMKSSIYASMATILMRGSSQTPLFLVAKGVCDVMAEAEDVIVAEIHEGSHFGEAGFLNKSNNASNTVRVSQGNWCQIFELHEPIFWEVLSPYTKYHALVRGRASQKSSAHLPKIAQKRASVVLPKKTWTPTDRTYKAWQIISLILLLYYLLETPFSAAFTPHRWIAGTLTVESAAAEMAFSWLVDIFFIIDIIMRFKKIAVIDPETGQLISEPALLRKSYIKSGFVLDVLAILPFELLVYIAGGDLLTWLFCFRLNRLLRLSHFGEHLESVRLTLEQAFAKSDFDIQEGQQMFCIFATIVIFAHVSGCAWHLIALGQHLADPNDLFSNWATVDESLLADSSMSYARSFYYSIATITTTGYGDIVPISSLEHILSCFFIFFGTMIFLFIDAFESVAAENANELSVQWTLKMNAVRQFVQTRDITPATVQMIDNYSQYIWETQKGWTNADAMAYMPQHMKLELLSYLTRTVFLQMPLIQGTGNGFLDRLTLNLDLQTYSPGDVLAREKEPMDKCIIILQGDVSEIDEQGTIGQVFGPGEVIGEGVLQEVLPCKSSLVAVSFLNVAVLHKRVFESIVVQFPKVSKHIKHERDLLAVKRQWFEQASTGVEAGDAHLAVTAQVQVADAATIRRAVTKKFELEERSRRAKADVILYPDSRLRQFFTFLATTALIYTAITIPIRVFIQSGEVVPLLLVIVDAISDLIFLVEMGMQWRHFTIYQFGVIVSDRPTIQKTYVGRPLLLDILATNILDWIVLVLPLGGNTYQIWNYFRLTRLLRVFFRADEYLNNFHATLHSQGIELNQAVIRIFSQLFFMVFVLHLLACGWYFVAVTEAEEDSWLNSDAEIIANNPRTPHMHYLEALYYVWVTMATVGYGDISPSTYGETIFGIFVMVFGSVMYAKFISNFASLISQLNAADSERTQHEKMLSEYFENRKEISDDIAGRIKTYYYQLWDAYGGREAIEIMEMWPQPLKEEVTMEVYGTVIRSIPIFDTLEPSFMRRLVSTLESKIFSQGDFILTAGHISDTMFMLRAGGYAEIHRPDAAFSVTKIGNNSEVAIVGSLNLLQEHPRKQTESVIATNTVDSVRLRRQSLVVLYDLYPLMEEKFSKRVADFSRHDKKTMRSLSGVADSGLAGRMSTVAVYGGFMVIPGSTFFIVWRLLSLLCLLLVIIFLPYSIAFVSDEIPVALAVLNAAVDVFFLVDLYLKIRRWTTTKMWKDTKIKRPPHEITAHYFSLFDVHVEPNLSWRGKLEAYLDSALLALAVTPLVLVSLGMTLADVQIEDRTLTMSSWFVGLNYALTAFFFLEMCVRLLAHGPKKYFTDVLRVLDFGMVVVDLALLVLSTMTLGPELTATMNSIKVANFLRILRLLRLRSSGSRLKSVIADIIGTIPLDLFVLFGGPMNARIYAVMRCNKLLLTYRLSEYLDVIQMAMDKVPFFRNIDPQTRKTNIMLMVILLVLHFIGCIWYAIGEAQLPNLSWLNLKGGHLLTKGISAKYLDSFSWALATTSTVGYGDYSATNATEVVCVILVIVCGALINAALIGSYSVYSSYLTQEDHRYEVKTQYLRRYFTSRNIPTRIRHRILLYHQFVHNNDTVLSDFEVLNILPMEFRKEVNYALYSHLMDSMAVLVDGDEGFLAMLCSILRPQVHLAGEHVLKAGDFNTELFFLHKGRVEVLPDWFKGKPYTGDRIVLEDGAHFGEITFFLAHVSSATILCLSNVELLVVTREDFRILLHSYPYIRGVLLRDFAGIDPTEEELSKIFMIDPVDLEKEAMEEAEKRKGEKNKKRMRRAVDSTKPASPNRKMSDTVMSTLDARKDKVRKESTSYLAATDEEETGAIISIPGSPAPSS